MKSFFKIASLVFAALVSACSEPAAPPPAPATAAAAPSKPKAAAVAAAVDGGIESATYVYSYNPVGRRDPFRTSTPDPRAGGTSQGTSNNPICDEPLCQHDLDQINLVAVVSGDANPMAMVEDPSRIGHMVRRGSKVGKKGGKVTDIARNCMTVTEWFQTPDGKLQANRTNVCVKKDQNALPVLDLLSNKAIE